MHNTHGAFEGSTLLEAKGTQIQIYKRRRSNGAFFDAVLSLILETFENCQIKLEIVSRVQWVRLWNFYFYDAYSSLWFE